MFKPELDYFGGVSPPSPKRRAEREQKVEKRSDKVRKWIFAARVALGATLLSIGLFFLIGGVWNYFFGTRIGVMLSPLMLLFGGSMIFLGIIVVLKLRGDFFR